MSTAPAGQPPLLNIANMLTGLRVLLVPVFLVALFVDGGTHTGWRLVAFAVFVVAACRHPRVAADRGRGHDQPLSAGKCRDGR